jgi:hypothetical protein
MFAAVRSGDTCGVRLGDVKGVEGDVIIDADRVARVKCVLGDSGRRVAATSSVFLRPRLTLTRWTVDSPRASPPRCKQAPAPMSPQVRPHSARDLRHISALKFYLDPPWARALWYLKTPPRSQVNHRSNGFNLRWRGYALVLPHP